jgi:lipid A 4'-phosphatase
MLRRAFHPWGWVVLILAALTLVPQIDLSVSAYFHAHDSFPWRQDTYANVLRRSVPRVIVGSAVLCALLWVIGLVRRRPVFGLTAPRVAYLVITLIVGPGLLVETLLKPHWHRPRPEDVIQFGGSMAYAPPLWIADGCTRNCSFVSGHAAVAFWLTAYAFLLPPSYRRWGMAVALALGSAMGALRIMQGAHFLSDVAYAGALVVGVNALTYRFMFGREPAA